MNELLDTKASDQVRTASDVINQAIAENKAGEMLLYGFAVSFVIVGLLALVWAVIKGERILGGLGFLTSALFWPAMAAVRRTRRESIAIRLLEAPLSRADTAKDASKMLQQLFLEIFRNKQEEGARDPRARVKAAR